VNNAIFRKKFLIIATITVLVTGLTLAATLDDAFAKKEKVTICHKPGTPAEKTKQVPESAVQGHLGHGDTRGECGDGPEPFCGDGVVNQPSEQCDDGNNSVIDGCWLCQLPTGTGSNLLVACSCADGTIFPNMCIESCSGDSEGTCSSLCLAETGNPTITGTTCTENHPECS